MKTWVGILIGVGILALACLLINVLIGPLLNWLLRAAGVVALVCVGVITFHVMKKNLK